MVIVVMASRKIILMFPIMSDNRRYHMRFDDIKRKNLCKRQNFAGHFVFKSRTVLLENFLFYILNFTRLKFLFFKSLNFLTCLIFPAYKNIFRYTYQERCPPVLIIFFRSANSCDSRTHFCNFLIENSFPIIYLEKKNRRDESGITETGNFPVGWSASLNGVKGKKIIRIFYNQAKILEIFIYYQGRIPRGAPMLFFHGFYYFTKLWQLFLSKDFKSLIFPET